MITPIRFGTAVLCLLLASCGGGGGGGGGSRANTISLDKTTLTFATESTQTSPAPQTVAVTFSGAGVVVGTLPGQQLPPWLSVNAPTQGTSPVTVTVTANAAFLAQPGRNSTTLRFATGDASGNNIATSDLTVTFTVDHTLSPANSQLAGNAGAANPGPGTSLTLTTSGATWEATSNQTWLNVTPASGTGSATLNVTTNPAALAAGISTGTITVRDTLTNRTRTATIDLTMQPRRLEVEHRGVALVSTAGSTSLSQAVQIVDSAGVGSHWAASDDAPWLSLSAPNGLAGTALTLTADDTGLADGIYYGTVTVSPDNEPSLTNNATIRVGLYVNHTDPAPPDLFSSGNVLSTADAVADPIRPYLYLSHTSFDGTQFQGSISVHNIYTGAVVDTLPFPTKTLREMAISADGELLIVNNVTDNSIVPITLNQDTRTVGTAWTGMRLANGTTDLALTRVAGTEVVLTGERQMLSATTGAVLAEFSGVDNIFPLFPGEIVAAPNGSAAFLASSSGGNHQLARLQLSSFNNVFRAVATQNFNESGSTGAFVVNPQSTRLVSISDLNAIVYDTSNLSVIRSGPISFGFHGHGLAIARNGDIYSTTVSLTTITQYNSTLVQLGRRDFGILFGSQNLAMGGLSGDNQRAFAIRSSTSGIEDLHLMLFDAQLPP